MKRLGLLRHAKSDWDDSALRDFDRGLNRRGRKGAALMGGHIRERGDRWDLVVASPAERVRLTLEASGLDVPVRWDQQVYLADLQSLMQLVQALSAQLSAVLLAGHNPGLQELLLSLAGGDGEMNDAAAAKFPTASYAVLDLAIEDWVQAKPGCGKLVHFCRPRDLDPQLGPDQ